MPGTRQAFVPQPVVDRSPRELRAYIEGTDPVTGRPFMQEVIEGLTRPLDDEDLKGVTFERSTPRLLEPDTEDNLQRLFIENHWTDYLPIILPTEERVAADARRARAIAPDKVVGRLRPATFREFWEFTVEKVAVNAVMAGARPEYFPVILALAASGITARSSSTTSIATISVVNGPIRNEIGMNAGIGALGPYNHANATIGRAYGLLSQNLQGGSVPGDTYMGSLGNWYAYSAILRRERGAQPLGAVPRRARLQADREHGQHLLRRLVHACRVTARARPGRRRSGAASPRPSTTPAAARDGPDRRARLRRAWDSTPSGSSIEWCAENAGCRRASIGTINGSRRWSIRWRSPASSRTRPGSRPRPTS